MPFKGLKLAPLTQHIAPILGVLIAALIGGIVLGLPVLIGVWIPDIVTGNILTVATGTNARGDKFSITQQWSRDFYTTWFTHSEADGRTTRFVLDGDGPRIWKCNLRFDEAASTVHIPIFGHEVKYHWDFHTRYSLAGDPK